MKSMSLVGYEWLKMHRRMFFMGLLLVAVLLNAFLFGQEQRRLQRPLLDALPTYQAKVSQYRNMKVDEAYADITKRLHENSIYQDLELYITMAQHPTDETEGMHGFDPEERLEELRLQYPQEYDVYMQNELDLWTESIHEDQMLLAWMERDLEHIQGFEASLDRIDESAERLTSVSIFQEESSYAHRNIQKTAQDFSRLRGLDLQYDMPEGFTAILRSRFTDFLALGLILISCVNLIGYEKDRKLLSFLRTTLKGKAPLIVAKIVALFFQCILISVVLYGSHIALAVYQYGLGDLSRLVQSMPEFRLFIFPMRAATWLFLYVAGKMVVLLVIGLCCLFLLLLVRRPLIAYLGISLWLGASFLAFLFLPANSVINHVKYINVFAFLDARQLYTRYQNLNFFGFPVSLWLLFILSSLALVILFTVGSLLLHRTGKKISLKWLNRLLETLTKLLDRIYWHSRLFVHEFQNLFLTQRGWLILLVLSLYLLRGLDLPQGFVSEDEHLFRSYLEQWQGPVTPETRQAIEEKRQGYEELEKALIETHEDFDAGTIDERTYRTSIRSLETKVRSSESLRMVEQRLHDFDQLNGERDIDYWLLDERAYRHLFALEQADGSGHEDVRIQYHDDIRHLILCLLVLVIMLSPGMAAENKKGLRPLISSSRNGQRTLRRKRLGIAWLVCGLVMAIIYGLQLIQLQRAFGFAGLFASVHSLPQLQHLPADLSLLGLIACLWLLRFLAFSLAASIILVISSASRHEAMAMILSSLILLVPVLAFYLGIASLRYASLLLPASANMILTAAQGNAWQNAWLWSVGLLAAQIIVSVAWLRPLQLRRTFAQKN